MYRGADIAGGRVEKMFLAQAMTDVPVDNAGHLAVGGMAVMVLTPAAVLSIFQLSGGVVFIVPIHAEGVVAVHHWGRSVQSLRFDGARSPRAS